MPTHTSLFLWWFRSLFFLFGDPSVTSSFSFSRKGTSRKSRVFFWLSFFYIVVVYTETDERPSFVFPAPIIAMFWLWFSLRRHFLKLFHQSYAHPRKKEKKSRSRITKQRRRVFFIIFNETSCHSVVECFLFVYLNLDVLVQEPPAEATARMSWITFSCWASSEHLVISYGYVYHKLDFLVQGGTRLAANWKMKTMKSCSSILNMESIGKMTC